MDWWHRCRLRTCKHSRTTVGRITHIGLLALVFLDQCPCRRCIFRLPCFLHAKQSSCCQGSSDLAWKARSTGSSRLHPDSAVSHLPPVRHRMGWFQISLEQWSHHRAVRRLCRPSLGLYRLSSLAWRQGNLTTKDPQTAQHNSCICGELGCWSSARHLCFLLADLVSGHTGEVAAEVWPVSTATAAQQRFCCDCMRCRNELARVLHAVSYHRECYPHRRVSTAYNVVG